MFQPRQRERLAGPGLSSFPYRRKYTLRDAARCTVYGAEATTSTFAEERKLEHGKVGGALGMQQRGGRKARSPRELEKQRWVTWGARGPDSSPCSQGRAARALVTVLTQLFPTLAAPGSGRGSVTTPEGRRSAVRVVPHRILARLLFSL